jgi:hypothetical protein
VDVICPLCKTDKHIQTVTGIIHPPSGARRHGALARRLRLPDDLQVEAFVETRLPSEDKPSIPLSRGRRWIIGVARLFAFTVIGMRLFRKIRDLVEGSIPEYQAYRKRMIIKLWGIRSLHNDLYYCHRHDMVFLPGAKKAIKPERKLEILYQP